MEHEENELDTLHVSLVSQLLSNRDCIGVFEFIVRSWPVSARDGHT